MQPDVHWHASTTSAAEALADHVRLLRGPGVVSSGRLCPSCGSSAHGRPWLRHEDGPLHVSLSRSGPHLVTVIAGDPVGVDVEVEEVDVDPALVMASGETGDVARTWARKEAVLKLRGTGLATAMSEVVLADETWRDLPAPEGYVAAVATGGIAPPARQPVPRSGP